MKNKHKRRDVMKDAANRILRVAKDILAAEAEFNTKSDLNKAARLVAEKVNAADSILMIAPTKAEFEKVEKHNKKYVHHSVTWEARYRGNDPYVHRDASVPTLSDKFTQACEKAVKEVFGDTEGMGWNNMGNTFWYIRTDVNEVE